MNGFRIAAPVAVLVAALLALPALADPDAQGELDASGFNHYILKCDTICPKIVAAGTIDPAFTGAWFDPKQSGHGLFIEILPDNRIQALWFTFNPAGTEQAWFVGAGTYAANKASISAVQPKGGRWIPNFDPSRVVASSWGTLNLAFTDDNHGVVGFDSTDGYGTGTMRLTRLSQPVGAAASASGTEWSWVRTGSPNVPREGSTATLLANGKVLLVGGAHGPVGPFPPEGLNSAEVYDPATDKWSVTGALHFARMWHTATLLPDGRVLVAGGGTLGGISNTAEVYDPTTEVWSMTGRMADKRFLHAATLLRNGKVLVMAGSAYTMGACELFDPATGQWSQTGSLVVSGDIPGDIPTATLLQDGRVLLVGGTTGEDLTVPTSAAEIYDPDAGQWGLTARLPEPRADHSATLLQDGKVMIAGGWATTADLRTSIVFDPSTETWGNERALKQARSGHTATLLADGSVMVAGGGADARGVESYNVGSAQWDAIGEMNVPRRGHTATLLPDGTVLVVGGDVATSAEIYGPTPPGIIVPAYTGSWYDPAQPGHGLVVEVLPNRRFLAAWFAFNPAGTEQAWFMGTGTYSGNTATVDSVLQPTGGRWIPNFDPSRIVNSPWGTLTLTFSDCNHGRVAFASILGYGAGSMNLTRLTQPAGLACQ